MIKKIILLSIVLALSACSKNSGPLSGVYYGYYKNNVDFYTLVFVKNHPRTVALMKVIDGIKFNSVFYVTYRKEKLVIHARGQDINFKISSDSNNLTCLSCDGETSPITYSIGKDNGKPFSYKVAVTAYKKISMLAKANGTYLDSN